MSINTEFTVTEFFPSNFSQLSANWYAEDKNCPIWIKYTICLLSNITAIVITPLAILCDLIASLIFKLGAISSKDETLNNKSWEFFKSGALAGPLVMGLAFIRLFSPNYSSLNPIQSHPDSLDETACLSENPSAL